jgi:plastocyanin
MTKNGNETDVDCGGNCGGCMDGKMCAMGSDCLSQVCSGGTCAVPSCTDTAKNGSETDVDCGGTCPSDCANGKGCSVNGDCQSGFCNPMTNMCAAPACNDGFQNGSETDTDCGGPTCGDCMNGDSCAMNGDCTSGFCNAMMVCAAPTCMDMVQNGSETDTDCGGPTCPDCMNGDSCNVNGDCSSGYCNSMMTCAMPTCTDGVQNGSETDTDCGGPACPDCMNGDSCMVNGDCVSGFCNAMMTCAAASCNDGIQNGMETGVDCGGPCLKCNGATCSADSECSSALCYEGVCVANVNGCTPTNATDLTGVSSTIVTFANGNLTYAPKCIKVKVGTTVTLNGNFAAHPTIGGTVVGMTVTPATSGPFVPVTNSGNTKNFVMNAVGTFPYYCQPHATLNMTAAVFVVP